MPDPTTALPVTALPVATPNTGSDHDDPRTPEKGIALCLSGGGYRAMLFHVGALWRLYEAEILPKLDRISSVSGGSITAGLLGLRWNQLSFKPANVREDFVPLVVKPIRELADTTIDQSSVLEGIFTTSTIG